MFAHICRFSDFSVTMVSGVMRRSVGSGADMLVGAFDWVFVMQGIDIDFYPGICEFL